MNINIILMVFILLNASLLSWLSMSLMTVRLSFNYGLTWFFGISVYKIFQQFTMKPKLFSVISAEILSRNRCSVDFSDHVVDR